jgi:hypothetical protein
MIARMNGNANPRVQFARTIRFAGAVLLFIVPLISTDTATAISPVEEVCSNVSHSTAPCLRWCREVEQMGKLDELSVVKESNCRYVLRKDETAVFKSDQSACVYRLRRSRQNSFSGARSFDGQIYCDLK